MQPKDKINKSSWTLHQSVKDAVADNVVAAIHGGQLKIESASVEKLLAVISASADEGYHRGARTFSKVVESALAETSQDAELDATMPGLTKAQGSKKK